MLRDPKVRRSSCLKFEELCRIAIRDDNLEMLVDIFQESGHKSWHPRIIVDIMVYGCGRILEYYLKDCYQQSIEPICDLSDKNNHHDLIFEIMSAIVNQDTTKFFHLELSGLSLLERICDIIVGYGMYDSDRSPDIKTI